MKKYAQMLIMEISISLLISACSMFIQPTEQQKNPVTGIAFVKNVVEIINGETEYIKYTVSPVSLQNQVSASWQYDSELISIDPDKYGVVVKAKKSGQTYLKASINGITTTCLISIIGNPEIYEGTPHIYSNFSDVQLKPGDKTTVHVSLYGGTSIDAEDFKWEIKDSSIAEIAYARGSCVITAKKKGSTQLKVSHPLAAYSYTMIIFVYTDDLSECYLTTDQNVLLINKSITPSRTIAVDIKNPSSLNYQNGFSYEFIREDGSVDSDSCATVVGNGNTAIITPVKNGIAKLRVTHTMSDYPLDVFIKIVSAVQNTYIVPSVSPLIITGSDTTHSVYADIIGTDSYINPDAFVWEVLDNEDGTKAADCMDWEVNGNCIAITGKRNGAFKIRVKHDLAEYPRTILVVLKQQTESAIDTRTYITTTTNFLQTKVGAPVSKIRVSLVGGEAGDENQLLWKIENGIHNDICKIETPTGNVGARAVGSVTEGAIYITPKKEGTAKITVSHPKIATTTDIMVKVASEYALLAEPAYINTQTSLIKMLNGTTKEVTATLTGNAEQGDENAITWKSAKEDIIAVAPATGQTAVFSASGTGNNQTYVSVKHAKALAEKKLLVLSADSQEALDTMKGFYADTTYFRVEEGASCTVEMKQFGLTAVDIQNITWETSDHTRCIVSADSGNRLKAKVDGILRGNVTVTAKLSGVPDCIFNITVCPVGEADVLSVGYLTTTRNAVVIPAIGDSTQVSVTGVNISSSDMTVKTLWETEEDAVISLTPAGETCTVTALQKGKTKIQVSNPESANNLEIDVKVGALYEWADEFQPYITTETDTVTMVKGQTKTIGASVENAAVQNGFSWAITGKQNICNIIGNTSGTCVIEALEAGMTEITIRNPAAAAEKQILIVVSNTPEELAALKHLTTDQNVVTIGETYNTTVKVSVKNAAQDVLDGYQWKSLNPSIADVVASGSVAVIYGRKQGSTKITVTNDQCDFPLEIIVNVVDPVLASQNPYIACQNIVSLRVQDDPVTVTAELIGGTEADNVNFTWHIQDPSIASLYASNETAQIKALKEGVTQLIVSHPKTNNIDRTVLIICEPVVQTQHYITVTESIIKMSPGDPAKTITATLVNGNPSDSYNFKWWADNYDIIDMNYTGESAVITPIGSGQVTIHCSHPKAAHVKDIVLYISQYSEFAFEQTSISLTKGSQSFINMQVPVTNMETKIAYKVRKPDSSQASDLIQVSGTDSVCILDPRAEGSCIVTAELVARNSGVVQASCELLVNILPSEQNITYINYPGSTILNIEKGEKITLNATIAGNNAVTGDEKSIKWKSSDPSVVKLVPAPSASGYVTNNEVQLVGVTAGKECTVTISHSKANSDIILYCIVPGENVANILLDRTMMNLIQGDAAQFLTANITNAQQDDYTNLEWSVAQDENNPAIVLSGTGKKVSILPKNIGEAVITATVPSSLRKATCTVKVEEPKSLKLAMKSISLYPGEIYKLAYTVSPDSEKDSVVWTLSDSAYCGIVNDDHNGTLTIYGKAKEGITTITGTTKSKATASITVNNGWKNAFTLSKSLIKTIPVDTGDGTFKIDFEVRPSCAEIRIKNMSENIVLKEGTYESYSTVQNMNNVYRITERQFTEINKETGIAKGSIYLEPHGETIRDVIIEAYNPTVFNGAEVGVIDTKNLNLKVYYNNYNFDLTTVETPQSNFSRFDKNAKILCIGDGETLNFDIQSIEQNATPIINSVKIKSQLTNTTYTDGKPYNITNAAAHIAGNRWTINLLPDVTSTEVDQQFNTSVVDLIYIGTLDIHYTCVLHGSEQRKYSIPLYLEVRNCAYNYGK